jgi:hypothetical protein
MVFNDVFVLNYGHPGTEDVLEDIQERKRVGIARYGTPLRPFDGRVNWIDLYQELLDALNYLRKGIYEEMNGEKQSQDLPWMVTFYKMLMTFTLSTRVAMSERKQLAPSPQG